MTTVVAPAHPRGATLLALAERLVNRGASALVTFGMALFVDPREAGAYAFGMLALTLAQALGESVLRQVGVAAWRYDGGGAELARIARRTAAGGGAFVALALVAGRLAGLYDARDLLILAPLALVAVAQAWWAPAITLAQYHGRWGSLTRAQSLGGGLSLLVALPLLPIAGITAGVLQTVVAEIVFAAIAGRALPIPAPDRSRTDVLRAFVLPTAVSNAFGWANGQADRLIVTLLAGAGPLGLLSIALAVAKSATDAVLGGTMNVLRSRLAAAADDAERARVLSRTLWQSALIAAALQAVVSVASVWPLGALLSPAWRPALAVVPLLAMSGVPMAAHYAISAAVIDAGRARALRTVNVVSLVVAIGVGVLLSASLPLGAFAEALADVVGLAVVAPLMRHALVDGVRLRLALLVAADFAVGIALWTAHAA